MTKEKVPTRRDMTTCSRQHGKLSKFLRTLRLSFSISLSLDMRCPPDQSTRSGVRLQSALAEPGLTCWGVHWLCHGYVWRHPLAKSCHRRRAGQYYDHSIICWLFSATAVVGTRVRICKCGFAFVIVSYHQIHYFHWL